MTTSSGRLPRIGVMLLIWPAIGMLAVIRVLGLEKNEYVCIIPVMLAVGWVVCCVYTLGIYIGHLFGIIA